ncbi:uncharacterized protein LACBIDRAFT_335915 [Laccaria bicolor S238N-H82]|uniref:Predicted protein n=1 Tax=Laccaria bicolor (strain S238N-H82 / ATCC MYA-4686) TaxID=486041 RepID=B0E3T8_LACBS|nr:uncharacterized protein LACBIDRAFT_335915 [Laccaria bicolor S238N-H82]EDQ98493.1 predicted protein [Laccaria bicolor S238N-H82]|eukprot:XP_001890856.1 predicted protein [Laccaria bicolor S238N-H82]
MDPLDGITCQCGRFVPYKLCQSDVNGNKGRPIAICQGPNSKGKRCNTFRWKKGYSKSPSSSPTVTTPPLFPALSQAFGSTGFFPATYSKSLSSLPPATAPAPSFPLLLQASRSTTSFPATSQAISGSVFVTTAPPGIPQCPTRGCGQTRIAPDCQHRLCRKHCISNGGCTSKTHTGPRSAKTCTGSYSASPPATTVQPVHVRMPTLPLPPMAASSHKGKILIASPSDANARMSPDVDILDALPNPRFRSHMPPIFTSQWKREQELAEEQRRVESEQKPCAAQVKHTVIVYAWAEDLKPATVEEFQEGLLTFTWPYFPLSTSVLSMLSLNDPATHVQLYCQALGTWVNINVGHVIELKEGARVFLKPSHVVNYPDFDRLLKPESTPHLQYKLTEEHRELHDRYRSKGKAFGKAKVVDVSTSSSEDGGNDNGKLPHSQCQFHKQTLPPSFFQLSPSPLDATEPPNNIIELSSNDCSSGHSQAIQKRRAKGQLKKNLVLRFPTNPTDPIVWDSATLQQAIDDEEFEPPKTTDRYVKEARWLERDEKEAGASQKKGGKGGKWGPFYWGRHDQLDFDGLVSFEYAYDPERNPIDENGIRRYLVADVFATPCTKCTAMKKPCFFASGELTPLGRSAIDEQDLNKACAPCKESRHKCPGHSRLRQWTIIDNPFYKDGLLYKEAKKSTPKPAVPKATAPKKATPKLVAPKAAAPTPAPKQVAPKREAPVVVKVAGPSKPQVKGIVPNSPCPMLSEMSLLDSTLNAKPKAQPSIALPSDSAPTEIGKSLQMKSNHPTDQFNCPARTEDHIITLEKQCRRLAAQVEETREKLDGVIKEWKEDMAELLLKLKKMEQLVTSTKDWTTQKVIFAMESLFLLGNGIHAALLELVTKMTDLPEEMGTLVLVESDDSVTKVKELLERAKPKWEEMIQVLEARLPCAQDFQRGQSTSPPTDAGPRSPGAADVIHTAPTVTDAAPHSPGTAYGTDMAPTIAPSTPAPASNAPSRLHLPIAAKQQSVVATATAGVAPAAPSSPTAPNTEGVELTPVEVGPGSPLTAIGSRPTSPLSGDERNMSTGRKRKADEEVDADITRKKLASNRKKGPLSAPQRRQPTHGKAPDSVNPATAGQSSKLDTIIEEDL